VKVALNAKEDSMESGMIRHGSLSEAVKKSELTDVAACALTPGPSPRWGEGEVHIRLNSLAPSGGEGSPPDGGPAEGPITRRSEFFHTFLVVMAVSSFLLFCRWVPNVYGQAQAFNASLSGTVFDHTGAAVPGAAVTLLNPDKGFSRNFNTSNDGRYGFTLVPAGTYTLKVESAGFRPYSQSGIVLAVGQSANQDITLEVGAVTEEVTVTAAVPILNTGDANVSSDVTQRQAVELPLNLRNVFGLVLLNSSVNNSQQNQALNPPGSQGTADQDIAFFNFGGGRFGTTAFLLDGHWDGAGDWDGTIYVPGVDELQEFKIQTNAFTAQYGWSMGNVVNAITKSGTNSFHGNAFEFLRNNNLDANYFFNNRAGIPNPQFKRNQFGFTAGGPLSIPKLYRQRDKTFIFGAYEGLRQQTPLTLVTTVPTSDFRSGNFSALLGPPTGTDALGRPILAGQIYNPFTTRKVTAGQLDPTTGLTATQSGFVRDPLVGNIIPEGLRDPVARNLLQYWPNPTGGGLVNNYTASGGAPVGVDKYTVRVDHVISNRSRMFARWSQERQFKQLAGELFGHGNVGGPGTVAPDNRWDIAGNYNLTLSPTFVMSVNLGYNRWVEGRKPQGVPFNPSSLGMPSFLDSNPGAFPSIQIDGTSSLGSGGLNATPREARTYAVDFTKIRGAHTMNIGFMGVRLYLNTFNSPQAGFHFPVSMTQGPDPTAASPNTGYGFASFLLGTGDNGGQNGVTLNANGAFQKGFYGWYFQDDWKATRKLTLNLGIRYDFQTAPTDRFDRYSWFDYTDPNPISKDIGFSVPGHLVYTGGGNRRGIYQPQYNNFAPRLGLTYLLKEKLLMRAGFGMFYIPAMEFGDYQGLSLAGFTQTTPYVGTVDGITPANLLSNPFPGGLILPPSKSAGALTNVGQFTNAVENFRPTPYVEQWSLGFQYELTPNNSFDVTYVGNHGVKLLFTFLEKNQLPPNLLALGNQLLDAVPNPFFGHITSSGCGLDQPTVPRGQLLRPFPEFCSVQNPQAPAAFSNYNSVQFTFNHRWSQGMQFLASFTISKYLDNAEGFEAWTSFQGAQIRDFYNTAAEKSLNPNDIPKSLVLSYIYELPFGRGKRYGNRMNSAANAILGGWQVSGVSAFKDGFPLGITAASNNTGSLGGFQRPNLSGDPHVSNPTIDRWFNIDAFTQPAAYTFGNVPRYMSNLRAAGLNSWDLAIQRWWNWQERIKIQFRAEMFNAFNHPNFYAPNTTFGDPGFGQVTGALPPRDIQFGLKIHW